MNLLTKIELATASEIAERKIAIAGVSREGIQLNNPQRLCLKVKQRLLYIWVKVESSRGEKFIGKVWQTLSAKDFGINKGDLIEFKLENIVNPYVSSFRDF